MKKEVKVPTRKQVQSMLSEVRDARHLSPSEWLERHGALDDGTPYAALRVPYSTYRALALCYDELSERYNALRSPMTSTTDAALCYEPRHHSEEPMPYDDDFSEASLLCAELKSVYAQLDHLSAVAQALYVGTRVILQALEDGTPLAELSPVQRGHLHLALRQARRALHMAEHAPLLEEMSDV